MRKDLDSLDLLLGQVKKSDLIAGKTENFRRFLKSQKKLILPQAKPELKRV